jgi:hypothetical protein
MHGLTGQARKIGTGALWVFCDQGPDQDQFFLTEIATTVTRHELSSGDGCFGNTCGCLNS